MEWIPAGSLMDEQKPQYSPPLRDGSIAQELALLFWVHISSGDLIIPESPWAPGFL